MKISVLIPFRSTDPQRIRLWNWLRPQWESLSDVELCSTADADDPDERFSFARGANRCRNLAIGDVLLVHGADQLPPTPQAWDRIRQVMAERPWMWVYAETLECDAWSTRLILEGHPPDAIAAGRLLDHNFAVYAVRADVWDAVGGLDERLIGWGPEDAIFRLVLRNLYPDGLDQGEGVMRALWHEPAPKDRLAVNNGFYDEYMNAINAGRLREYLQGVKHGQPSR